MKLRVSATSPYVRKVRLVAAETGLAAHIDLIPTDVWAQGCDISKYNPLGKIPALITDDGQNLYDSAVICEYLDSLHGGAKLFPEAGPERWQHLRLHALCDGILDALVAVRIETAIRPPEFRWRGWIDRQTDAMLRALDTLESEADQWGEDFRIGQISAACALSQVDFRYGRSWRDARPRLAAWWDRTANRSTVAALLPQG